jgi:hypothetical protein
MPIIIAVNEYLPHAHCLGVSQAARIFQHIYRSGSSSTPALRQKDQHRQPVFVNDLANRLQGLVLAQHPCRASRLPLQASWLFAIWKIKE